MFCLNVFFQSTFAVDGALKNDQFQYYPFVNAIEGIYHTYIVVRPFPIVSEDTIRLSSLYKVLPIKKTISMYQHPTFVLIDGSIDLVFDETKWIVKTINMEK